jgi:hypothetical protein
LKNLPKYFVITELKTTVFTEFVVCIHTPVSYHWSRNMVAVTDENVLKSFERRIPRKFFGPVWDRGEW